MLDGNGYYLLHYIYINLEENILSGQFDSLDLAAGNAAIALVPKMGDGGYKNETNESIQFSCLFTYGIFGTGGRTPS